MAQPVLIPPMRPVSAASRARYAHKQLAQGLGGLASEQLGDLEFRQFLDPVLANDPIARFGYDPERFRVMGYPDSDSDAVYAPRQELRDLSDALGAANAYGYREIYNEGPMSPDRVYVTPHFLSSPDVISHEYRHRGLKNLVAEFEKNEKLFRETFDPEIVDAVERFRGLSPRSEELIVEYYDNPDAPLEGRFATMAETLDYASPQEIKKFQGYRDSFFGPSRFPLQLGLERGVQQMLSRDPDAGGPRTGEPPRAKYREPGILDSIRRGIGALFGG